MNPEKNLYLVPHDFSEIADCALRYAINMAKDTSGKVLLTHIVKNHDDIPAAKLKVDQHVSELPKEDQAFVDVKIIEGSIFKEIGKTAEITNASLIVMGSHGAASSFQKLFGSNALKVVGSSAIPFLIIQDSSREERIKNIVLPFSFAKESVQIVEFASSIASKFNAKIHLVGYRDKDSWLARDMKTNEAVVRRHFASHKIDYELVSIPANSDYEDELLKYAHEINADLIAAAYFSSGIRDLFHKFLQTMIENEHGIPVLTINAVEVMSVNSNFSFLSV